VALSQYFLKAFTDRWRTHYSSIQTEIKQKQKRENT